MKGITGTQAYTQIGQFGGNVFGVELF